MASIYGLYDCNGRLRYIGKANDPHKRLKGHMREIHRRRTPLYDWLKKHGAPEMRILETDCQDWREAERRLIAKARQDGEKLLNLADGGDEPFCSMEVRRENGRRSRDHGYFAKLNNDPLLALAHRAKRELPSIIKLQESIGDVDAVARIKSRMRELHSKLPDLFPKWADV